MAQDRAENFDIAEEVARGLAMKYNESTYPTHPNYNGTASSVGELPYNGSLTNGSYYSYLTTSAIENVYPSYPISSTSDACHLYGDYASESMGKRSTVGRKPPKGPDGIRRYSSRRATVERRDRINSRERDRMHQLCDAFERLRQVLPCKRLKQGPHRQKLSKISTLLLAQNYIRSLEEMLRQSPEEAAKAAETNADGSYITSQHADVAGETNGQSVAYYSVGDSAEYERSLAAIQYSYDVDHKNTNLPQDYYRLDHTTQYQYL